MTLTSMTIFWGEASENRAIIYARTDHHPEDRPESCSITGVLQGPFVEHSHTIPATYLFQPERAGATLLARCVLVDPCFWTPQVASLYRVKLVVTRGDSAPCPLERMIGIRRLGVSGSDLRWEGKRWVLRAVSSLAETPDWRWCRESGTALVVTNPSDALCDAASRAGVLVVAWPDPAVVNDEFIERLARWPAVGIYCVESNSGPVVPRIRYLAPNLLIGQVLAATTSRLIHPWADVLVTDATRPLSADLMESGKPILVRRTLPYAGGMSEARVACDTLQREFADSGRISGYVV